MIVDEWANVEAPRPPELKRVTIDPQTTALLVLDIQNQNCNEQRRPRCVASLPRIQVLLKAVRERGMLVVYSLTRSATPEDIRSEVAPYGDEPIVKAGVDKFFRTELDEILRTRGIEAVIVTGTSAHGAVLHTGSGAALRGHQVIVPVDCMSAGELYAEQYVAWHLANSPGTQQRVLLTRSEWIQF